MFTTKEAYRVYLGLNDRETGKQEITTKNAIDMVKEIATQYFEGATISTAIGLFNGKPEKTIVVYLTDTVDDQVKWFAEDLRDVFNQECVMIEKSMQNVAFI